MTDLKFCANLSFMFQEKTTYKERLLAAKNAGFRAIEAGFLYEEDVAAYAKVKEDCGLEQVLINSHLGDVTSGDFGLLAMPGREKDFENSVVKTFHVADTLKCKRIHFLSGKITTENEDPEKRKLYYTTMATNLKKLIPKLEAKGITALVEPINNYTLPNYFLSDFETAVSIVKTLDSPYVRLQLDVFHLQQINGNLTRKLKELIPVVGHIQIAQVPNRNEPNSPGEIDYKYILELIKQLGYNGWIGLEYSPLETTEKGLNWIPGLGCSL